MQNCRRCGKVFHTTLGERYCKACSAVEDQIFKDLKECICRNPGISPYELAVQLNISVSKILRYVQDGMLGTVKQ